MQGEKSATDSVPENVDVNLGSFPLTFSTTRQDGIASSSHMPSCESSSSHAASSGDESYRAWNFDQSSFAAHRESQPYFDMKDLIPDWSPSVCTSAGAGPSSAARNFGQPSFLADRESQPYYDMMDLVPDWSPSVCTSAGAGPSSAVRQLELPHNVLFPETADSRNPDANLVDQNNLNANHRPNSFLDLEPEDETPRFAQFRSSHIEGTGGSSSSVAACGSSSCKRKSIEGSSGESIPCSSSSDTPQAESFAWPNETPPCGNSPEPMNLSSSSSQNPPILNFLENPSPSAGLSVSEAALEPFPPISIIMDMGTAVGSRNFDRGGSSGSQQEPYPFNLSSTGSSRHPSGFSLSRRHGPSSSLLDSRSTRDALSNASQLNATQAPQLPRTTQGFPWTGAQPRSMWRCISETLVAPSAAETRNEDQDTSSRGIGQSSSTRPWPQPLITPLTMSREIVRALESVPWAPESFDGQRNHLPAPSSSSSSGSFSNPQRGLGNLSSRRHRRSGFSVDRQGDEFLAMSESSSRGFMGDAENRNHVIAEIRQVLNAMRHRENLRAEDYVLFEPHMFHGLAEIHDRHRDMRLDVDNMSYEELLELGERIGDVSTGLKEEIIIKLLKQHKKQIPTGPEFVKDTEPCCICQEQYVDGEEVGELDCGHDFHLDCIKQWLMLKNICPICKTTGLAS